MRLYCQLQPKNQNLIVTYICIYYMPHLSTWIGIQTTSERGWRSKPRWLITNVNVHWQLNWSCGLKKRVLCEQDLSLCNTTFGVLGRTWVVQFCYAQHHLFLTHDAKIVVLGSAEQFHRWYTQSIFNQVLNPRNCPHKMGSHFVWKNSQSHWYPV